MEFQHAYSKAFRGSDLKCEDPSLTQQQFKEDVDINVLLERFKVTGQMPQGVRLPTYGDFSAVTDFRSAQDAILKAKNAFMELPASVRAKFDNDPQKLLEFVSDPANKEEAIKMGLFNKPSEPAAPVRVEVVGGIGGAAPDANGSQVVAGSGALKP